jgi:DNA-binding CsgD family transcriptional regulator/tetratricopeptide (TPR) repeat protein
LGGPGPYSALKPPAGSASGDLLERGPALVKLSSLLHEASTAGRMLFLCGEAGVGKSALVSRFAAMVGGSTRALVGTCDPLSTPRPLGPLLDVAGELLPRAGPEPDLSDRNRLFRDVLTALGDPSRRLVVVLEDLHWADDATLDLLRFVGRRLGSTRALIVGTYRADEVGERHPLRAVLGDLATATGISRLQLQPLTIDAVRALAVGTGIDPLELHRQTGGNPFFVTEILASGGVRIPATVRDAVLTRVGRLSASGRRALEAASVIGFRIEPWLLEKVAGDDAGSADEGAALGILVAQGAGLAFRHELGRQAVLESLQPLRVTSLHRAILSALGEHASSDPARLAHHAEGAGDTTSVLTHATEAARRAAAVSANREAAAQYARALRFADQLQDDARAALIERHAQTQAIIGRFDEAIPANRWLVEHWRRSGNGLEEGRMLSVLAGSLVSAGRNAEAEEAGRAAIRQLERFEPGEELAGAYSQQAALRMLDRDCAEAVEWADRALAIAEPGGQLEIRLQAYNRRGAALLLMEDQRGQADLELNIALAREAGLPRYECLAYTQLGSIAGEQYQLDLAEQYLRSGLELAREHELDSAASYQSAWLSLVHLHRGRWQESEDTARPLLRTGVATISTIMATLALARVLTRRGDPEAATALDEALELALPTGTLQRVGPVRAARAEAAVLRGDLHAARLEARAALDLSLAHRHRWIGGELLMWLTQAGEPVDAPDWIAAPFAAEIRGDWRAAATEWRRWGCPYEAERALLQVADEEELRSGLATLEAMGAGPLAKAFTQRLRHTGAKGIRRGPRATTAGNPAQLTDRQVEIVQLLAQGLQNAEIARRLFISPKTVDHHVSASLAKLGVRSRTEAARAAARLGLLTDGEAAPPI